MDNATATPNDQNSDQLMYTIRSSMDSLSTFRNYSDPMTVGELPAVVGIGIEISSIEFSTESFLGVPSNKVAINRIGLVSPKAIAKWSVECVSRFTPTGTLAELAVKLAKTALGNTSWLRQGDLVYLIEKYNKAIPATWPPWTYQSGTVLNRREVQRLTGEAARLMVGIVQTVYGLDNSNELPTDLSKSPGLPISASVHVSADAVLAAKYVATAFGIMYDRQRYREELDWQGQRLLEIISSK